MTKLQFQKVMKDAVSDMKSEGHDLSDPSIAYDVAEGMLADPELKAYVKKQVRNPHTEWDLKTYVAESLN